jgi:hypothetical protein
MQLRRASLSRHERTAHVVHLSLPSVSEAHRQCIQHVNCFLGDRISGEPMKTERFLVNGSKNCSYVRGQCYSRLYTQRDGSPTINLRAGTLDDTGRIRPVAQIWTSSAQAWAVVEEDGILRYSEQPADFDPLIEAWKAAREATPHDERDRRRSCRLVQRRCRSQRS